MNQSSVTVTGPVQNELQSNANSQSINRALKLVVVVSGAVLMALEMTGSRVLAIHFGSSIYVWGAIIGIFLAALSIGYYAGGSIADRRPSFQVLILLLLVAGCWLLLIPLFANRVCRTILSLNPGERLGPLLATTILFGGPSILLGMVSPYAVRLAARSIESMGIVAGRLYALSTFGSIVGTLVTAFWLIPAIGVRLLLQILGLCLIVVSLAVFPWTRRKIVVSVFVIVFVVASLLLNSSRSSSQRAQQTVIYEADSAYHYVLVVDDLQRSTRSLQFNNYIEGAIDLNAPHETRVTYTNGFQLARIFKRDLKNILIIGGGGGIGARKFIADDARVVVDQVEIDPAVVEVGFKYFFLEPGPRLRVHTEDGRSFIRRARQKYDLIVLDAFTIGGQIPFHLTTKEFMSELQQALSPDGVIVANINGAMRGRRSRILRAEYKTVASVFENVLLFPHLYDSERKAPGPLDLDRTRSVILVAFNGSSKWTRDSIVAVAQELTRDNVVQTAGFVEDASQYFDKPLPLDDVPLLTDDYAPVDTMVF